MHLLMQLNRQKTICGREASDRGVTFKKEHATCRECLRKSSVLIAAGEDGKAMGL